MGYNDSCIHFRGIQHGTCKLDIRMYDLDPTPELGRVGIARRIPCIKDNVTIAVCAHCHYPTDAENAQHEAEMQAHMQTMREDIALIGAAHTEESTSIVYVCELCERANRAVLTTAPDLLDHMLTAHDIEWEIVRFFKGQMSQHLDAIEWSQTDYVFTHDGKRALIKSVRSPRTGSNRRAWQENVPTKRKGKR